MELGLVGLWRLLHSLPAEGEQLWGQQGAGAGLDPRVGRGLCGKESLVLLKAGRMNFS